MVPLSLTIHKSLYLDRQRPPPLGLTASQWVEQKGIRGGGCHLLMSSGKEGGKISDSVT